MFFSAPFILAFSIALCVSNISLIRHERFRFVNVLGIILAFLLVAGEVFLFTYDMYATGSQKEVMLHDLFVNLFAAVYLYFECMLIGAMIANIIVVKYEPDRDKDFLIILGCGLRKDGTPTPLLRGRIDRAIAFYEKQKAETGKELIFVTSGGRRDPRRRLGHTLRQIHGAAHDDTGVLRRGGKRTHGYERRKHGGSRPHRGAGPEILP